MTRDEIKKKLQADIDKAELGAWSADQNEDYPGSCSFAGVAEGLRQALEYLDKLVDIQKGAVGGFDRESLAALMEEAKLAALEHAGSLNNGFGAWYADYIIKHQEKLLFRQKGGVPCEVGDRLWCLVGPDCSIVMPLSVENIFINKVGTFIGLAGGGKYLEIMSEEIGKLAFWTEEEAVAAKEDCLKLVDDILEKAVERSGETNCHNGILDALERDNSGLFEDYC